MSTDAAVDSRSAAGQEAARVTVTVVAVTWNSARHLPGLLDSLPAALDGVAGHELVVADNASADGTVALARRLAPDATVVEVGRNAGYAGGINAGLSAARPAGAYLVLNPDVRLAPGSVARLLAGVAEPGAGIAVPRLVAEDGGLLPSLRREPTVLRALGEAVFGGRRAGRHDTWGEVVHDPAAYATGRTADWATGAVMLVSRACAQRVGPWDESFFLYSEETDLALRARDAGFACRYVPDATAVHVGGEAGTSPRLHALLTVNRIRLFSRRNGPLRAGTFAAAVGLNELIRAARGSRTSRAALVALLSSRRRRELLP